MPLYGVNASDVSGTHDYAPLIYIVAVSVLVGAIGAAAAAQTKRMWNDLLEHATSLGWRQVAREEVPEEIASLVEWHRPIQILRGPAGGDPVWLVWHQWWVGNGKGRRKVSATRFIAARPVHWPDLTIVRRTALGAKLMPVNGAGTGDRDFDRAYLVRADEPVSLTADVRAALVGGDIVPFEVSAHIPTILIRNAPDVDVFEFHVPIMSRLLALLSEVS